MDEYTGTGGITIGGSAHVSRRRAYTRTIQDGDLLYVRARARAGSLEKVVIKHAIPSVGALHFFLFEDTLNSLWEEDELCSYADAAALVEAAS